MANREQTWVQGLGLGKRGGEKWKGKWEAPVVAYRR